MTIGDASLPLQKAIVAALRADTGIQAIVGALPNVRVLDGPAPGTTKPYVSYGPSDVLTEIADEYEGSEETIQIDGWSAGPTKQEVKRLGRAIRAALHEKVLTLEDNQRLVSLTVENARYLPEPDGIGQHVAVSVRALTEPSA